MKRITFRLPMAPPGDLAATPRRHLVALALALACTFGAAEASRITLINNEVIEGQIVDENDRLVTIKTFSRTLSIPRHRIKTIEAGAPGSAELYQAGEALERNEFSKARELLEAAVEAGAEGEDVERLQELLASKQAELELQRHEALIRQCREAMEAGTATPAAEELKRIAGGMDEQNAGRAEILELLCDYHMRLAQVARDRVQTNVALEQLFEVIRLDPSHAQAHCDLGDIYRTSSATWNSAVENYARALALGVDTFPPEEKARIHWQMADIRRQQQNWRESAYHYREAYRTQPTFSTREIERVHDTFKRFARELRLSSPEMALRVIEEGLAIEPNADLIEMQGQLLAESGRYSESTAVFEDLVRLEPNRPNILFQIAQNFAAEGEILEAREYLQRQVRQDSDHYEALVMLGDYALQRDDFEAAEEFYSRAVEAESDRPGAALGLGKTLRRQGKLAEARAAVQEVLVRLPDDHEANLEMGRIYMDEQNYEQARQFFTQVLDLVDEASPEEQEELRVLKADALLARGEIGLLTAGPGTASIDFRRALDVYPEYPMAFHSIGRAYRKKFGLSKETEDLKVAEEHLMKARELEPENARFALDLGILYAEELAPVDTEHEQEYFRRAVENWRDYLELGGANQAQVEAWIREVGG